MQEIFRECDFVVVYLDDISILSDSLDQHINHIREVFAILKEYNIKLRLDKCIWGVSQTEYLGSPNIKARVTAFSWFGPISTSLHPPNASQLWYIVATDWIKSAQKIRSK
jgi:hypothetical protein